MKLSTKSAGLCASGAIILTTYTALFNRLQPIEILLLAVPGAVIAGFLGYQIGQILADPKGDPDAHPRKQAQPVSEKRPARAVTGNETFLDDLDEDTPPRTEPMLELFETPSPKLAEFEAMTDEELNR